MIRSLFKNSFLPKQPSYCGNGIRECQLGFSIPFCTADIDTMGTCILGKNKANYTEQPQLTRGSSQNRLGHMLTCSFKSQMSTHFLKRCFDRPAGCEPTDNLLKTQAGVCGIKVFVPVSTLDIMDKYPANRDQTFARLVPLTDISGKFHFPLRAAIPANCSGRQFSASYQLLRLWQFASFGARATI